MTESHCEHEWEARMIWGQFSGWKCSRCGVLKGRQVFVKWPEDFASTFAEGAPVVRSIDPVGEVAELERLYRL